MDRDELDYVVKKLRAVTGPVPKATVNGTRKIIVGIAGALLLAGITAGAGMLLAHGPRISVVETKVESLEGRLGTIEADGKASNSKLDTLLGRVPE